MKINKICIFTLAVSFFCFNANARELNVFKEKNNLNANLRSTKHTGPETADYLNEDYSNKAKGCDDDENLPAFLCSGVMLRGTQYSSAYHSWDPSPASESNGGVSFSYLRADSKYDKLAYGYVNGYIFYPYFYAPDGKYTDIDVMCSFPIDAATNNRSDKGCGASSTYPSESGGCQAQNITNADEWYEHYKKGNNSHAYQCGFETKESSIYDTTDGFYQSVLSMAKISSESFTTQNELRLATWNQGMQDTLPIEAFFYLSGSSTGLSAAKNDQHDFYISTTGNIWVPVIKITLPTSASGNATFTYSDNDQWILQDKK